MTFLKTSCWFNSLIIVTFFFSCTLHGQEQNYVPTEAEVISHAANFFEIDVPEELDYKLLWYSEKYVDSVEFGWGNRDLDFVDIEFVFPEDTAVHISIYSCWQGRYGTNTSEFFTKQRGRWSPTIDISYSHIDSNWFVLSGIGKKSEYIHYLKVYDGPGYRTFLKFWYPKSKSQNLEAVLTQMSQSLKSH